MFCNSFRVFTFFFYLLFVCDLYSQTVIGILRGKHEIVITAKSQGELKEIFYHEGDFVKAGDLIAQLDNHKEIIEAKMAENDFLLAKNEYEKSKELVKYLSQDELSKKENDFFKKKSLYELKKYYLESKSIKSPIDGVLVRKYIKMGENISSGTKAFEVIQFDELEVDLYVNAQYLEILQKGQKLKINHELNPLVDYWGEVFFIGPAVDKASGTVNVKLKLLNKKNSNGDYIIRPGVMVKVLIK